MSVVTIIGAGAMGSAFAFPAAHAGNKVHLVGTHLDHRWIAAARSTGIHPKLDIPFPQGVDAYQNEEMEAALEGDVSLVVLGVSSPGVGWAVRRLLECASLLPNPLRLLMLTKGLAADGEDIRVLPDVVAGELSAAGMNRISVGGVGGPCIAAELAAGRHSTVVFAGRHAEFVSTARELLACSCYHIAVSLDLVGVEACAALKNFYALGVGYAAGMLEGEPAANEAAMHNPAAALFTQAVREMAYLVPRLGGNVDSVYGLPGVGDLYVTCRAGRNSRMGRLLGTGTTYREAKSRHMPEDTVEGADLALAVGPALERKIEKGELDGRALPLARRIIAAVCGDEPLRMEWDNFA